MRRVSLASFAVVLLMAGTALAQDMYVDMRINIFWADGRRLADVQGMPGVSATQRDTSSGTGRAPSNSVTNMDIRVRLIGDSGATIGEKSPDSEGVVTFNVLGSTIRSGAKFFPTYQLRVFGSIIEEVFLENLQPGLGDRSVMVRVHRKGEKDTPGGGLVSATSLKIPSKAQKELDKGNKELAANKFPEAREHFEKAVAIYPQYDMAYNNLGVTLMKLGDQNGGRQAFQKSVEVNDKFAPGYLNLARIQAGEKKYDEAAENLMRSLSVEPLNAEALSLLCQMDLLRGKYEAVPANARKLHSIPHEGQALGHFAAGNALEHLNNPQEAIAEYTLFIKEDPYSNLADNAREAIERLRQKSGEPQ